MHIAGCAYRRQPRRYANAIGISGPLLSCCYDIARCCNRAIAQSRNRAIAQSRNRAIAQSRNRVMRLACYHKEAVGWPADSTHFVVGVMAQAHPAEAGGSGAGRTGALTSCPEREGVGVRPGVPQSILSVARHRCRRSRSAAGQGRGLSGQLAVGCGGLCLM
jgi:hypothetical protein